MNSVRESLAAEAAEAEARRSEAPAKMHRARNASGSNQVYTVRMPADRLAELRTMAEASGEQPSALMRRWVLERLEAEQVREPDLDEVRRRLADALHTLDQISNKRTT